MTNRAGANAQDIKQRNRQLVLRLVCEHGPISRAAVARRTGLTRMSATNIVQDLISAGLVCEMAKAEASGAVGRPSIDIDVAPDSPRVIGLQLGRTHMRAALGDMRAGMIARVSASYPERPSAASLRAQAIRLIDELRAHADRPIWGIGIAAPGPLDARDGVILCPPNFHGIRDWCVAQELSAAMGLPVALCNDAAAGALAERQRGVCRDRDTFLYVRMHNGVGAGLMVNGALYCGANGMGGEIGHMSINEHGPPCDCGNRGCLEVFVDTRRLVGMGRDMGEIRDIADHTAVALVNCLNLMDFPCVVLCRDRDGKDRRFEDMLEERIGAALLAGANRRVRVIPSVFGVDDAPIVGAMALAMESVFEGEWA